MELEPPPNYIEDKEDFLAEDKVKRLRTRRLKVHAVTWNTNSKPPPQDLLPKLFLYAADIFVVSLQELGSFDWIHALDACFSKDDLVRIKSRKLQGILIVVYVQRHLLDYITHIESESTKTGLGGMWGNKGGVSVRFDIYGVNVIFVNAHLAAHAPNVAQRVQDVNDIIDNQKFRDDEVGCILDHDYVIWMGDLNFRVDTTYEQALQYIQKNDLKALLHNDQLKNVMKDGLIFQDFKEAPIYFKPTFKFDVGTDIYDTSQKRRVPSYCDRVLCFNHKVTYGKKDNLNVSFNGYQCHQLFQESDHKPVSCTMEILGLSRPSINPVIFKVNKTLSRRSLLSFSYSSRNMELTTSDWIGVYHVKFTGLLTDYITYVYAQVHDHSTPYSGALHFPANTFTNMSRADSFVLCYFSKKYSFSGISKVIKLRD